MIDVVLIQGDGAEVWLCQGLIDTDAHGVGRDIRKKDAWTVSLEKPEAFNRLVLQEDLNLGQRIAAFTVEARVDGKWETVAEETTVGFKRIVLLPDVTADAVRVRVDEALAKPYLRSIALYQDDIYHE